jgi:hypothetical protein
VNQEGEALTKGLTPRPSQLQPICARLMSEV